MIGLVDCNNFFVSCERLFRPDLKNKPAVVLGSNDGIVVARSEEAKKLGIPMGVPYFKVKDILKEGEVAIFSGNFDLYRDISRRVMATLRNELDEVYQYSVDEAFFRLPDDSTQVMQERLSDLKKLIERDLGIPVSLGAGRTMTIAKYASEKEKRRSGVSVLVGEDWLLETPKVELADIWGVGGQTAKKMREHGLYTVEDFLKQPRSQIEKLFGVHGLRLHLELSEEPAHDPGERSGLQKSIMSTRSFPRSVTNLAVLEEAITYHVDKAAEELREIGGQSSFIKVILGTSRYGDFALQSGKDEISLAAPTDDTRVLLHSALELVHSLYDPSVPYKKAGVILGDITPNYIKQFDLFTDVYTSDKSKVLMSTMDTLNEKWGSETLMIGRVGHTKSYPTDNLNRSPRYTTSWDGLLEVTCK